MIKHKRLIFIVTAMVGVFIASLVDSYISSSQATWGTQELLLSFIIAWALDGRFIKAGESNE